MDAVVNSTNETMDDNSPMCQRIFVRAGSALKMEIFNEIKGIVYKVENKIENKIIISILNCVM